MTLEVGWLSLRTNWSRVTLLIFILCSYTTNSMYKKLANRRLEFYFKDRNELQTILQYDSVERVGRECTKYHRIDVLMCIYIHTYIRAYILKMAKIQIRRTEFEKTCTLRIRINANHGLG